MLALNTQAPEFDLLEPLTGKQISLSQFENTNKRNRTDCNQRE